ncbi:MAG: site-2 protease family protein [Planctomycetes bacterium]|nr:site-2 protease family protein [Planctomycetota bacterium]
MFGSFHIGRLFGIQVRVHWMFIAMVVLLAAGTPDQPWYVTVFGIALAFTCVLLHELGHSLVAKRFGIKVYDITLWPLGGMARMDHIPEIPKVEAAVAIAGPAVNFVLATVAGLIFGASSLLTWFDSGWRDWLARSDWIVTFTGLFVFYNLALGVFNLVPAFPMDGGRVLRAVLGAFRDWVRATEIAVTVGRVIAFAMFAFGAYTMVAHGFTSFAVSLMLVALFIGWAGARELWAVRLRHGQFPFGNFRGRFGGVQFQFGGAGAPAAEPTRPAAPRPEPLPNDPGDPSTGARRPLVEWKADGFGSGRIDDSAVARLERFRGRITDRDEPAE